jgi:hypothetical protein
MSASFSHARVACLSAVGCVLLTWFGTSAGRGGIPADSVITLVSSNLPIVVINTHGQWISDEPKITADMGIIDNGFGIRNRSTDAFSAYDGKIGIETRGSSSEGFPKKQYAVETRDASGNDLKVSLLGMPEESDWVLSAPYCDKSLIRDVVLYSLAVKLGHYASRSRYCELVLNGEYAGVYILLEKIKRDKNRVNIAKITETDTSGDALTGGYIVKIDKTEGSSIAGWYSGLPPFPGAAQRIFYQFHYPKDEDLAWAQRGYITRFIRDFELAMVLPGFSDPVTGYSRLIDVDAFVDYVLLNELSKNVDAYRLSCFMYKDRDSKGGKLVMGPVWDYNIGFGNCNYHGAWRTEGFQLAYMSDSLAFRVNEPFQGPFWWKKIFEDAFFRQKLNERWRAVRTGPLSVGSIMTIIDSLTTLLDEAQQRNFIRWPVLGRYIWPNYFVGSTYQSEIGNLKSWIADRIQWLDLQLNAGSVDVGMGGSGVPKENVLGQNYPNPFNASTTIGYRISEAGTRDWALGTSQVRLSVYDILGREVALLVNGKNVPGSHEVTWDATGFPSGVYIYRMIAGDNVESRTMLLAK